MNQHSEHDGASLCPMRCQACGAAMTSQRKVNGKIRSYCPVLYRPELQWAGDFYRSN